MCVGRIIITTNFSYRHLVENPLSRLRTTEYGLEMNGEFYYSDRAIKWLAAHGTRKGKKLRVYNNSDKMQMVEASHYKNYSSQRFFGIPDRPTRITKKCDQSLVDYYTNVFESLGSNEYYRYITPLECERLQTIPDNYTNHVSKTQRYKMIGNAFTVDTITHILSGID